MKQWVPRGTPPLDQCINTRTTVLNRSSQVQPLFIPAMCPQVYCQGNAKESGTPHGGRSKGTL